MLDELQRRGSESRRSSTAGAIIPSWTQPYPSGTDLGLGGSRFRRLQNATTAHNGVQMLTTMPKTVLLAISVRDCAQWYGSEPSDGHAQ